MQLYIYIYIYADFDVKIPIHRSAYQVNYSPAGYKEVKTHV